MQKIIDTARMVCVTGSMKLSSVALSVCLSVRLFQHSAAARRCIGFAAVGPAATRYRLLHGRSSAPTASSVTLSAHVGSLTQT